MRETSAASAESLRSKYSMVLARPSCSGVEGRQSRKFCALVMSGLRWRGSSCGSGRYSIINSLGNVPVLYMIRLDGWGGDRWGPRGLSATEAVVSAVGAAILLVYFLRQKKAPVDLVV